MPTRLVWSFSLGRLVDQGRVSRGHVIGELAQVVLRIRMPQVRQPEQEGRITGVVHVGIEAQVEFMLGQLVDPGVDVVLLDRGGPAERLDGPLDEGRDLLVLREAGRDHHVDVEALAARIAGLRQEVGGLRQVVVVLADERRVKGPVGLGQRAIGRVTETAQEGRDEALAVDRVAQRLARLERC